MKPKFQFLPFLAFPRHLVITSSAMLAVLAPLSTSATTLTWDGGDATSNSWTAANNWDPDAAPTFDNTADVVINTLTRPLGFISDNTTVKSLSFGANVDGAFSIRMIGFPAPSFAQAARNLTFDADSGNATVTVDAGATGDINIGSATGDTGTFGNPFLADNLEVIHNGTGLLLFNRPFQAGAFSITTSGTGKMQTNNNNLLTGALNLNGGTLIANTYDAAGLDLNNFSAVNLGGGTLEIRPFTNGTQNQAKTYATVPVNVNAASTLSYKNINATISYTAQFTGANAFAMNADLTVKNISTTTTLTNAFNIGRAMTGSGDLYVETYNNIASSSDSFTLGRIQLNGNNSGWSGDIVISKGTAMLGGTVTAGNVNAAGTGDIIIGTAADAFGAGLTFLPGGSNVTYANDIIVNTGGFRAIKGNGGNNARVTFTGGVTLNKDLTVDHTWSTSDNRITFSGAISGTGGLAITRTAGNVETTAVLSVTGKTYTGDTTVASGASLSVGTSLTSDIVVQGGRIGGGGSTSQDLSMAAGSTFFFFISPAYDGLDVAGTVTLDNSFSIASLVGGSRGEPIPWDTVPNGTYTLIGTTASTFSNITNFGPGNAAPVGTGTQQAYFQNGGGTSGGGLQLVVTAGASGFDTWKTTNSAGAETLADDHDGDGVDNGTEYFLFGNASSTGFNALPGVVDAAGTRSVTWTRALTYYGLYNVHFFVETSETLDANSWVTAPLGSGAGQVSITGFPATSVKYTFPTGTKQFARLRVTGP